MDCRRAVDTKPHLGDRIVFGACLVCAIVLTGLAMYDAGLTEGRHQIVRECPLAQEGERLLSSVQYPDGTTYCSYLHSGYGSAIKRRKTL